MKVVIIGLGSIASRHIEAIKKNNYKNLEIFALRHSRESNTIEGIKDIYDLKLIEKINPNFIIISNPTSEHYKTLTQVFKFNIPLFIEKPLFSSIGNQEEKLVSLITEKNIKTYIACNLRFHLGIKFLKKEISKERIEEVNIYCGSYLPNWRPNRDFRKIYSANKEMGGGVHIDLIHELDYLYWIFNEPNLIKKTFKSKSSLNISSIDYANYVWEYDNFSANIILNYYRKDTKRTIEVLTDKGTYLLDLITNKVTFNDDVIFESTQQIDDIYCDQMNFFIEEVIGNKKSFNTIAEGYKILKYVLE